MALIDNNGTNHSIQGLIESDFGMELETSSALALIDNNGTSHSIQGLIESDFGMDCALWEFIQFKTDTIQAYERQSHEQCCI